MLDMTLSILALIAGGVSLELFADVKRPQSPQEERRLALGTTPPDLAQDFQAENPS